MKNVFKNALKLMLICSVGLLTSCEAEKDLMKKNTIPGKRSSEVSFSEFKKETGLNDFKKTIKFTNQTTTYGRNADGSYELSDFDIDTEVIKRLELDAKITYTFRIYPKVIISPTSFYNLTLDNRDGQWIQNVVELKPSLGNFDSLMSGATKEIDGQMTILYTSDVTGLNPSSNCYSVGIVSNNCSTPEIQENCINEKYVSFCFDNENNVLLGDEATIFNDDEMTELDYSFMLNTNDLQKNLRISVENHILITNQILALLENEINVNFDSFPFAELSTSENEESLKSALANAGVVKNLELADLLIELAQNGISFNTNNKDFSLLRPATKQLLINEVVNHNIPMPEDNSTMARTCGQQYAIDKARCNRNATYAGWGAIACFLGGPIAGGAACLVVIAQTNACLGDAVDDYHACAH
jgi:hypothetical protein